MSQDSFLWETQLFPSRMNLQEAAVRYMHSCEHAREMCLIAKRSKEMTSPSVGFLPHLLCRPSMEESSFLFLPQARLVHSLLPLYLFSCAICLRLWKSVNQTAIFKHGTKPSQANSQSLHGMKEERKILQHCFTNEPRTFVVKARLSAVHSFFQVYFQLFAKAANQCTR